MIRPLALILIVGLTGCAAAPSTFTRPRDLYNPQEYPFYYDALWADLFWRCAPPAGGGVGVQGYAIASTRTNMAIFLFEVGLEARDGKGNILFERWSYGDPFDADNITPIAFALDVPKAAEAVGYNLRYRFQSADGGGDGDGTSQRRQAPRVVLVQGFAVFGTVVDVCSDQYRRQTTPSAS
jgi:hypothetical protein